LSAVARALVLAGILVVLNFLLPRALPGDPLAVTLSGSAAAPVQLSAAARADLAAYYGLDLPLATQLERYLAGLAHGDLGRSIAAGRPVGELIAGRIGWSVLLAGLALAVAALAGTLLGVRASLRQGARGERALTGWLVLAGVAPGVRRRPRAPGPVRGLAAPPSGRRCAGAVHCVHRARRRPRLRR